MKIFKTLISTAVVVAMLSTAVLAADDGVGSPVTGDGPKVVEATDADGNDVTDRISTTWLGKDSDYDEVNDYLDNAANDITEADDKPMNLEGADGTLKSDLEAALEELGSDADVEDLDFDAVFDASFINSNGEVEELTGPVTITVEYTVEDGMVLIVIHNYETGKWEVIDPSKVTVNDDGTVTIVLDNGMSPFAFLSVAKQGTTTNTPTPTTAEKKSDDSSSGTSSPQTGEHAGAYLLIVAVALAAAGVVCVKRAKGSAK